MKDVLPIVVAWTVVLGIMGIVLYIDFQNFKRHNLACGDHGGSYHKLDTGFWSSEKGCVIDGEFYHITNDGTLFTTGDKVWDGPH